MITTHGVRDVAGWLGVTRTAVSNWRKRYGVWPVEPAVCVKAAGGKTVCGWLPGQRDAWLAWYRAGDPGRAVLAAQALRERGDGDG